MAAETLADAVPLARIELKRIALVDVVLDPDPVRFDSLDTRELDDLLPLTNTAGHDKRDWDSDNVGSAFRERIKDRMNGEKFPGVWVVRAWDAASRRCIGWTMFDVDHSAGSLEAGFYVMHECRRQGIGRVMLNEVRRLGKQRFRCDRLVVRPWNHTGRRFFDSAGAHQLGPELREIKLT